MECKFCGKRMFHKSNFVYHLRAVHKVGAPVQCQLCGKRDFGSRSRYYVHIRDCRLKREATAAAGAKRSSVQALDVGNNSERY